MNLLNLVCDDAIDPVPICLTTHSKSRHVTDCWAGVEMAAGRCIYPRLITKIWPQRTGRHSWNSCFREWYVGIPRIFQPECSSIDLWLFCQLCFTAASAVNSLGSMCACVWFTGADRNSIYRLGSTACYLLVQIKGEKHADKQRFHFLQLGLNIM